MRTTIEERCFLWSVLRALLCNVAVNISAAVNQHATIEETLFSVGATSTLYKNELTLLERELSRILELAVAAEN
jgi:hypothetical protein